MAGQRAVVTGGAGGVGARTALELGRAGASVAVYDINEPSATVDELRAEGRSAEARVVNVTDRSALAAVFADHGKIDVLITCSGVYGQSTDIDSLDDDDVATVLNIT